MRAAALALGLALGGCVPGGEAARDASGLTLLPGPGGIEVVGSGGREIGFGRARAGAVRSAVRVTGMRPVPLPCAEAARDAVRLGDLVMVFQANRLVGADGFGQACTPAGAA